MITVTSNAVETAARFDVAIAAIPAAMQTSISLAAEGVKAVIVPAIRARTPIGKSYNEDGTTTPTGGLAASTNASITEVPDGADIAVVQPAVSAPNRDGSGGGFPYVLAVVKGRKAITAPPGKPFDGPLSTGKMALRTPWGPRRSVKAAPGVDYITPGLADAAAGMESAVRAGGLAGISAIMVPLR